MDTIKPNKKKIFLLDSGGAILSMLVHGLLFYSHQNLLGIPKSILLILVAIAFSFATFSFLCFHLAKSRWRGLLKTIASINLAYCLLIVYLIIQHYTELTVLGISLFSLEVIVIIILAMMEFKMAGSK